MVEITKLKGWIARNRFVQWTSKGPNFDGLGDLNFFVNKPKREGTDGWWWNVKGDKLKLNENSFPKLKWTDEPIEVQLTIKQTVK